MTNTEAKGGEPCNECGELFELDDLHDAPLAIYDSDERTDDLVCESCWKMMKAKAIECVRAFSGHDPSDSVVLSRGEWEVIEVALRFYADRKNYEPLRDHKALGTPGDQIPLIDCEIGELARSALAAAERGRG